jgi:septal ring factor EnvC (AmiA/AmiB activator)
MSNNNPTAPSKEVTLADLQRQIAELNAEKSKLSSQLAAEQAKLAEVVKASVGMTDSGCISLKGIRKSYGGVHLYPEEWSFVAENMKLITEFATANASELKKRSDANKIAKATAKATEQQAAKDARIAAAGMTGATRTGVATR